MRRRERPGWLTVERGFGVKDLEDGIAGRRRLLEELERRAVEDTAKHAGLSVVDEQNLQSTLRRGWYYGRESFREWLLEKAKVVLRGRGRTKKNYHGEEVREHGEAEARRMIEEGLKRVRLRQEDLSALPKGDRRKAEIAARVRSQTTVRLRWLADELCMGTPANISQACRHLS